VNIRRWLGGYTYRKKGETIDLPPLWRPQLPSSEHHIELGFRDLIELRVIKSFLDAGLSMITIRNAWNMPANVQTMSDRSPRVGFRPMVVPFFWKACGDPEEAELLDLKSRQYVIRNVIDRTFKDLDLSDDIVTRWRPFRGKKSIVIDPQRAFGQPIATLYGVPTIVLAEATTAEGSIERVSYLYDVPACGRDAISFEKTPCLWREGLFRPNMSPAMARAFPRTFQKRARNFHPCG